MTSIENLPKFYEFLPYVLKLMSDGEVRQRQEIKTQAGELMGLTDEQKKITVRSGNHLAYLDRAGWSVTYLNKAGIIDRVKRGYYQISNLGREYIAENGFDITIEDLEKYEGFRIFKYGDIDSENSGAKSNEKSEEVDGITPEELIEKSIKDLNKQLSDELLLEVQSMDPFDFEKLVLDLLHKMGYGGRIKDAIIETTKSNDEGIDGMIKEDALGLDHIYVQAKRWKTGNIVGRQNIQQFAGALSGQDARKGIFIITSTFTDTAIQYAKNLKNMKIVLIDGDELVRLMIDYDIGVNTEYIYKIKSLDQDYFSDTE